MILKKAKNGDLSNYIKKNYKNLTWLDKLNLLLDISKALNSIHQIKLLHKDFHSKNILVDDETKIYIGDFGLCQHEEEIQRK
jgi:serine/threonine protein kinase